MAILVIILKGMGFLRDTRVCANGLHSSVNVLCAETLGLPPDANMKTEEIMTARITILIIPHCKYTPNSFSFVIATENFVALHLY